MARGRKSSSKSTIQSSDLELNETNIKMLAEKISRVRATVPNGVWNLTPEQEAIAELKGPRQREEDVDTMASSSPTVVDWSAQVEDYIQKYGIAAFMQNHLKKPEQ